MQQPKSTKIELISFASHFHVTPIQLKEISSGEGLGSIGLHNFPSKSVCEVVVLG